MHRWSSDSGELRLFVLFRSLHFRCFCFLKSGLGTHSLLFSLVVLLGRRKGCVHSLFSISGMGLVISRLLVELQHGTISAFRYVCVLGGWVCAITIISFPPFDHFLSSFSKGVGKGTTFTITLPLLPQSPASDPVDSKYWATTTKAQHFYTRLADLHGPESVIPAAIAFTANLTASDPLPPPPIPYQSPFRLDHLASPSAPTAARFFSSQDTHPFSLASSSSFSAAVATETIDVSNLPHTHTLWLHVPCLLVEGYCWEVFIFSFPCIRLLSGLIHPAFVLLSYGLFPFVFVVEDSLPSMKLMLRFIKTLGFHLVETAASVKEAVQKLPWFRSTWEAVQNGTLLCLICSSQSASSSSVMSMSSSASSAVEIETTSVSTLVSSSLSSSSSSVSMLPPLHDVSTIPFSSTLFVPPSFQLSPLSSLPLLPVVGPVPASSAVPASFPSLSAASFTLSIPERSSLPTQPALPPIAPQNMSSLVTQPRELQFQQASTSLKSLSIETSSIFSSLPAIAESSSQVCRCALLISDIGLPDPGKHASRFFFSTLYPDCAALHLCASFSVAGLSGLDIVRAVRERAEFRIPITSLRSIALSGYGGAEDLAASREAGFDIHLVKPCGLQVLETTICQLLCSPQK